MTSEKNKSKALLNQERKKLALWLSEWQLDQWLTEPGANGGIEMSRTDERVLRSPTSYHAPDLKDGDIRLMVPVDDSPPLYALVVSAREGRGFHWVPFSRFAHPALPEEWQTGLRIPSLQVLCIWNTRSSAVDAAPASWRVKRLSATQREQWWSVIGAILQGRHADEWVSRRTGPPLLHPADPRHRYMAEARERWDVFWNRGRSSPIIEFSNEGIGPYLAEDERDLSGLLLAAETAGYYGVAKWRYETRTSKGVVFVECERANREGTVSLRISDASGACLDQFDAGYLETVGNARSGPIASGRVVMHLEQGDRLMALVDAGGIRYDLKQVRRRQS